jgi:enoyl-CoA hydratase/carnithine racemase
MNELINYSTSEGIARLEINRPEKKNALTGPMYAALANALDAAEANSTVNVILIYGHSGAFTAGNDLTDFLNDPPVGANPPVLSFIDRISTLTKPFIAAVSGVAVGIGSTMLMHCDLVYADESARFQLPFVNLGLSPEAASSLLLPLLAGHARAAEMLLLGEPFNAIVAKEIGLVNEVTSSDNLLPHALSRARTLAAKPADAVRITKQLLKRSRSALIAETIKEENAQFRERLNSPEAKEAFAAFLEKRPANFSR